MDAHITTLTVNPSIDVGTSVDQVVAERKLRCGPPSYEPGGGGVNVSRAIANLGGHSTAVLFRGGPSGERVTRLLEAHGVRSVAVPIAGDTRESFMVLEESTGRQYRFGMPGPAISEAELDRMLDALRAIEPPPSWLVASGSLAPGVPPDFYGRVCRAIEHRGCRLVLDTSGEALVASARSAWLLKANLRELGQLVGRTIADEAELEREACRLVREEGATEIVVASLGAGGALLATREEVVRYRSPTVPIVSRVGAGDSMLGGILHALARGEPIATAVRWGVAAGTAAVMTPGTELCRREDTERLVPQVAIDRGTGGGPLHDD